jgi:hypothetical protein
VGSLDFAACTPWFRSAHAIIKHVVTSYEEGWLILPRTLRKRLVKSLLRVSSSLSFITRANHRSMSDFSDSAAKKIYYNIFPVDVRTPPRFFTIIIDVNGSNVGPRGRRVECRQRSSTRRRTCERFPARCRHACLDIVQPRGVATPHGGQLSYPPVL